MTGATKSKAPKTTGKAALKAAEAAWANPREVFDLRVYNHHVARRSAMAEPNWADEAVRYSAGLSVLTAVRDRGVFDSDTPGVSVVFAPDSEKGRIVAGLSGAGVEVLGVGSSLGPRGYTSVWLVRSTNIPKLEDLLRNDG